ncbi:hypothetical protein HHK36_019926 [Tetracentron sinense]|uniref:Uncharacterized protein n=1 Tax=Tetracentron sinense TaxID=13715 RepID=A0A834YW87_TETSI|nr:hypothetical protein HHK36_019926 [Tetracentron sinense]
MKRVEVLREIQDLTLHHLGQFLAGKCADSPHEPLQILDIVSLSHAMADLVMGMLIEMSNSFVQTDSLIELDLQKCGSVMDLLHIIEVDLYHVEKQAQQIAANDLGLMLIPGDNITVLLVVTVLEQRLETIGSCLVTRDNSGIPTK